ncbi:unnamed protein product, partial [Mesorhabditis spiculigera]
MAEELAPDGSGEAPTQQASLTFFDYGCCVPSWQGLWMLIVVLLLMIAACGFCIGLNVCLSVYYTRRSAQREEQLEKKAEREKEPDTDPKVVAATVYHMSNISPSPRIAKQNRRGSLSEVSCDPDEATVMERGSGKRAPRIDRGDDIETRTFTEEMSQEESRLFSSQRSPEFRSMRITEPMYTRDTPFWTNPQMRSAERHNQRPARPIIYDPPSTSTTAQTSTTRSSEPTRKSDGCQAAYVQGYAHRPMHHRPS